MTSCQHSANLWPMALDVGTDIHHVMAAGMNAYVWWYIVRYYGPISDGTNDSGDKGDVTKRGFIMSQYARFVRPGDVRIEATEIPRTGVYVTAYKGDSKLVIVAVNQRSSAVEQTFRVQNLGDGTAVFTPHVTSETKNCVQESAVELSGGGFTALLDAESVITFVADGVSGVMDASPRPRSIFLSQNYPNPFNPTTRIQYSAPKTCTVTLKVYDCLGREVRTLFEGLRPPGDYTATFDAEGLPGGVYVVRMKAGDLEAAKRMLLLK